MLTTALVAALLAGLCARSLGWLPEHDLLWLASALTMSGLAFVRGWIALGVGGCLASFCWGALLAPAPEAAPVPRGGLARASLSIARGGCGELGCYAEALLVACRELEVGSCAPAGTRVGVTSARELPASARVSALVRMHPRLAFRNPGPAVHWPDTRPPVRTKLAPGATPHVDHVGWLAQGIAQARNAIRTRLTHTLTAPHIGIARALLLGEGSAVDPELALAIRDAGVSHVLAVSGMHVTLLVGVWVAALRWLWLFTPGALHWEARRVGAALGALLAPLLAQLCGASPSAARAGWTSTLMYLVRALGLRPAPLPIAAIVVAGYVALEPREALHPGFMLSVLATAALLSDGQARSANGTHSNGDAPASRHAVVRALRESARAWLATTPFLLLCFGQASWVALVANVALLPLGEALVPLAAWHLSCALSGLDALLPSAALFSLTSGAFVEASRLCASLDPGWVAPPLSSLQALALSAVALAWLFPWSYRTRIAVVVVATMVAFGSEWELRHALRPGELRVTFLDVGQGDATLLESGDGPTMLIDAGGAIGPGPDPGALSVLPALRARRIRALDHVVLSHPHPDHFGGLPAVLQALPVHELWDNGQAEAEAEPHAKDAVVTMLRDARRRGTRVRGPDTLCNAPTRLGRSTIEVLAPCPGFDLTREPNDNSFVLRVTHGQTRFLLPGDAEREAEQALLARGVALQSEVLKVAHHGSRSSSTEAFLRAVAPSIAVVSAGRGNTFGHPHPEVATRLRAHARLLRTDTHGGVEIVSDGRTLTVRTGLQSNVARTW